MSINHFAFSTRCLLHGLNRCSIGRNHPLWGLEHCIISRISKYLWLPSTHLTVITYADNVVRVLITNDREWINWVLMTILSKTTLLNWLRSIPAIYNCIDRIFLCSNVPLQQIPCHCCTDDYIRVVRIEYCFRHFVLTIQSELWSTLHTKTEDIYPSIWRVEVPFSTLTVTSKKQLWLRWWPVNTCYCSIQKLIFLECKLLCELAFFIFDVTFFFVVFSKKVIHDIELLTKSTFH